MTFVKAYVGTLIQPGPEVDGFRRRAARRDAQQRRLQAWADAQRKGSAS